MLNQLFERKGDCMTLVQNKECIVLTNSKSISVGVQEESCTKQPQSNHGAGRSSACAEMLHGICQERH